MTNVLPALAQSLEVGLSVGLLLASPISRLVSVGPSPRETEFDTALREPDPVKRVEKLDTVKVKQLKKLVDTRKQTREAEHEGILSNFDELLSRVEEIDDPVVNSWVAANFERFIWRMTRDYPVWDSEGRMRTYFLMKKISEALDIHNADVYLDLAYKTLMARGSEAAELSHLTLNGNVEKMYRQPESEGAQRLAGTLMLMNREDEDYARQMVIDAIHLWSDKRFKTLKRDFAAVPALGTEQEDSILELLEKEMEKARRAKDRASAMRAKQVWKTILLAVPDAAKGQP